MSIAKNKIRFCITIHKSAYKAINEVAKVNDLSVSNLIEEIVMNKLIHDYENLKKEKN